MVWPFINGHHARKGVLIGELPSDVFVDALMDFFVEDSMHEKEKLEARDKARAELLRSMSSENPGYDSYEDYGRSNDNFGAYSEEPLPYIEPTMQTDEGYVGLMPPLA